MNWIKKYFSYVLIIVSIFFLTYIIYKSEIYWNGDLRYYYFKYYIISFILFLISFLSFFLSVKIKTYITIIMLSIIFGLYLFELYLIFFIQGINFDTRTKVQAFLDKKTNITDLVLPVFPSNYLDKDVELFPLSGISNSNTLDCNESGYYSIVETDRYGFNNPDEVWDKDNIDYALIGDSFVWGSCVNRPNDLGSVIKNISKSTVLNLGYGGNGPLASYASIKEYLPRQTKNIVWFYFEGNDNENLLSELENKFLKNYYYEKNFNQNLKTKHDIINTMGKKEIAELIIKKNEKSKQSLFDRIKILKLNEVRFIIGEYNEYIKRQLKNTNNEIDRKTPEKEITKIVKLMKINSDKIGANLYFVYLPEHARFKHKYSNKNYKKIKDIINKNEIYLIDIIEEVFKKTNNPLEYFPNNLRGSDLHYNEKGYFEIGNIVYEIINSQN